MTFTAIEVFKRYEKKYIITADVYEVLKSRLEEYMEPDKYNIISETYPVCSIYYDTPDSFYIRTSISRPKYKEKLRLRSYGIPDENSVAYVEIKKKIYGVVNKRRSGMRLADAYNFLETGQIPDDPQINRQVLAEVLYMFERHPMVPAVYLAYSRRAYFGKEDKNLRVSFDKNIVTRRYDLRLEKGVYGTELLEPNHYLMEIKTAGGMPLWLARLLSENKVFPVRFSKYGKEYVKSLKTQREIEKDKNIKAESVLVSTNAGGR